MSYQATTVGGSELLWFKSSYSDSSDPNDCVEVAMTPASVHVRDSKHPQGPHLAVTRAAWARFVEVADG
ncbi:DUF397 domain-containing protein [Streptomyces tagetis]|uniref:DUF397 domain-containing protein n=1 Tax=Streptomyces tagetis TaxID=2820809 RepID=A0A940XPL5_9ACTN|nr:DUF397 domain-containing protein [Streptomyces sp. RG38]MBQ0830076.1 DUF397 domain-containing protein [Streptomyces sp. RG38]